MVLIRVEAKLHDESRLIQRCFDDAKESRVKQSFKQIFKNQVSSFKFQDSRFKIQESSFKIQESKSRFKIQELREDLIKISMKMFFQKLSSTWIFSQSMFTKEFLLSGNRLPVAKWI